MLWKKGCLPDSHLNSKEQLWLWNEPWVHGALLWMSEWRMDLGSAVWFSAPLCDMASAGHKIHWKIPPCVLCCCKFRLCCLIQNGSVKHMLAAVKRDSVCWSSQLCHPRKYQLFMHWSRGAPAAVPNWLLSSAQRNFTLSRVPWLWCRNLRGQAEWVPTNPWQPWAPPQIVADFWARELLSGAVGWLSMFWSCFAALNQNHCEEIEN